MSEGDEKTVIAKLSNGQEGPVVESRENATHAGREGQVRKREKGRVGGTDGGAIWESDGEAVGSGNFIGAGSVGANEVAGAARVSNGQVMAR